MASYTFHTLSSSDFEILVRDLLNAKEENDKTGIEYKSFKAGKDQGIDLAYSTLTNSNERIVQIKHYLKSGLSALLKSLFENVDNELIKIKKLSPQPERYIVATSIELSKPNKEAIKIGLKPYVKELDDIISNEDLNLWLEKFDNIQKKHFKLWFNSVAVFQKILTYEYDGRNEFEKNELEKKIIQYVDISNYNLALEHLLSKKVIIITGNPGLGKTSLAEMLLYKLLGEGVSLHYIYNEISDIEKQLSNDDEKQVFYFDDFLGSTEKEIEKAKATESYLLKAIKRIEKTKNKYLILTTRKFILESNVIESEKLKLAHLEKLEYFISTNSLKDELKIQIIRNHCEIHKLEPDYEKIIFTNFVLTKLLNAKDFSPRFIDLFTNPEHLNGISSGEYESYILSTLNNPVKIWSHAFKKQIDESSRFLLLTLFSFGDEENIDIVREAFSARIDWEVKNNNYKRGFDEFNETIKKLESGFIDIFSEKKITKIKFRSPSLVDYLKNLIVENVDILTTILDSGIYLEQHFNRFRYFLNGDIKYIPSQANFRKIVNGTLKVNQKVAYGIDSRKNYLASYILLTAYNKFESFDKEALELIRKIDWDFLEYYENRTFTSLYFGAIQKNKLTNNYFSKNFHFIIESLISISYTYEELEETIDLFSGYNIIESEVLKKISLNKVHELEGHILEIINTYISEEFESLVEDLTDPSEAIDKLNEIKDLTDKINMNFDFNLSPDFEEYESTDWDDIARENQFRIQMEKDD